MKHKPLIASNSPRFPRQKRFDIVGPGAHNIGRNNGFEKIKGTPVIKNYEKDFIGDINAYYFVGNHLVYDSGLDKTKLAKGADGS